MSQDELKEKLTVIFRKVFKDDQLVISDVTTANDVERWDSLTHMTLISTVEDEFKIKFRLNDLVSMKNVGDLISTIGMKLPQ